MPSTLRDACPCLVWLAPIFAAAGPASVSWGGIAGLATLQLGSPLTPTIQDYFQGRKPRVNCLQDADQIAKDLILH